LPPKTSQIKKAERLLNLIAFLLSANQPQPLEIIRTRVEGYAGGTDATFKRRFERDKDELRRHGIPIEHHDDGYSVDPNKYYLPEVRLSQEEVATLGVSLRLLESIPDMPLNSELPTAAMKMLFDSRLQNRSDTAKAVPSALVGREHNPVADAAVIDEAIAARKTLTLPYQGLSDESARDRSVNGYGRFYRDGHWYLVGQDTEMSAARTFRLDRVTGAISADQTRPGVADYVISPDFDLRVFAGNEIWSSPSDDSQSTRVSLEISENGRHPVSRALEKTGPNSYEADVYFKDAFIDWVLEQGPDLTVTTPQEVTQAVIDKLELVKAHHTTTPGIGAPAAATMEVADVTLMAPAVGSQVPSSLAQLERLLIMVPYLTKNPQTEMTELERIFEVDRTQIEKDLNLAFMCGLPPYTPADLIDFEIIDDKVSVMMADYLARPLRITSGQAAALLICLDAISRSPLRVDANQIDSIQTKIRASMSPDGDQWTNELQSNVWFDMSIEAQGKVAGAIETAVERRQKVAITYHSANGDRTERTVQPYFYFLMAGDWYIVGLCELRDAIRVFRMDRISDADLLDERFEPDMDRVPDHYLEGELFDADSSNGFEVVLNVSRRIASLATEIGEITQLDAQDYRVVIKTPSLDWLAPRILQWGNEVEISQPKELSSVVVNQANRLLSRYNR